MVFLILYQRLNYSCSRSEYMYHMDMVVKRGLESLSTFGLNLEKLFSLQAES